MNDPSAKVRVQRILENTPSKITAIAPGAGNVEFRLEIVTKHSGGGSLLQAPRTITSPFTLEDV